MNTQICEKCGNGFSWKKIFKAIMIGYLNITCEKCKTEYTLPLKNRVPFVGIVVLFPLLVNFLCYKVVNPGTMYYFRNLALTLEILWVITAALLTPFYIRYKLKKGSKRISVRN